MSHWERDTCTAKNKTLYARQQNTSKTTRHFHRSVRHFFPFFSLCQTGGFRSKNFDPSKKEKKNLPETSEAEINKVGLSLMNWSYCERLEEKENLFAPSSRKRERQREVPSFLLCLPAFVYFSEAYKMSFVWVQAHGKLFFYVILWKTHLPCFVTKFFWQLCGWKNTTIKLILIALFSLIFIHIFMNFNYFNTVNMLNIFWYKLIQFLCLYIDYFEIYFNLIYISNYAENNTY